MASIPDDTPPTPLSNRVAPEGLLQLSPADRARFLALKKRKAGQLGSDGQGMPASILASSSDGAS